MYAQSVLSEAIAAPGEDGLMNGDQDRILIVDDENGPRQALRMLLKEEYDVLMADCVSRAVAILDAEHVDAVITDIRMPGQSGIELLRQIRKRFPDLQVIILTGYGQLDTAVAAIDNGAFAYIEKPFDNEYMLARVRACLEKRREDREHRALEELAFQANRFETLGRLVTGTMHDLGTPLSVIGTHLEMMLGKAGHGELEPRLKTMRAQVEHCTDIVRTTMNYLRQAPGKIAPFSLNAVVTASLDVARPILAKENIRTEIETDRNLPMMTGEVVLVRQAVLNLITNACQALQENETPGCIRLRTWRNDRWICVSVEDNGPGIPKEHRAHIFDALFTTKADRGTGLGLAVVRHVMEHHGGEVVLEDTGEAGARFVLHFPIP